MRSAQSATRRSPHRSLRPETRTETKRRMGSLSPPGLPGTG
jgi:hypothetical protein